MNTPKTPSTTGEATLRHRYWYWLGFYGIGGVLGLFAVWMLAVMMPLVLGIDAGMAGLWRWLQSHIPLLTLCLALVASRRCAAEVRRPATSTPSERAHP